MFGWKQAVEKTGPELLLVAAAAAAAGLAAGIHESSFNNYLYEVYHIGASTRGVLEFPRELPGLAAVFLAGGLVAFGRVRAAVLAMALLAAGFLGLGLLAPTLPLMVLWMLIWSTGNHLLMPLEASIAVGLAGKGGVGSILGQLGAVRLAATMLGAGVIWLGMGTVLRTNLSYGHTYSLAAAAALIGVLALSRIRRIPVPQAEKQARLVWRKEYTVYYALAFIHGIRKQVFITFAVWQLVQTFHQPAAMVAQLWFVTSMIGIVFRPFLGRLSDRLGERFVFLAEVPLVSLIFIGYAVAPFLAFGTGLTIMLLCYIGDALLSATSMIRTSYASKIMCEKSHLTPTLAMGVSLDHAAAMLMPAFGGLVWSFFGSHYLFAGGVLIMLLHGMVARYVVTEPAPLRPAVGA